MNVDNPNSNRWQFYALVLVFCFAFILALKWAMLPTFMDIFYHLSARLGFNAVGGFTTS